MKNPKLTTVYIDTEFKCHTEPAEGCRAFEVYGFEGKCREYIEGHRYVPAGERFIGEDGTVFVGEMMSPWKDYAELDSEQRDYERALIADMQNALNKLGVTLDE